MSRQPDLYFDYNATTPVDPRVVDAMLPLFTEGFGNSMSTTYSFGWQAESFVEDSRKLIAQIVQCAPSEITFTSGATESNNWVLSSVVEKIRTEEGPDSKIHFLISPLEHNSVLQAAKHVERIYGVEIDLLPIHPDGRVKIEGIESLIRPHTRLLAAMWVQNEVGAVNDLLRLSQLCRRNRIYFLCDATQGLGKIPLSLQESPVDFISFSAHKIYGPKGIGFLYQRGKDPAIQLPPLICGGGHERGSRSGTLNVPAIVGMAKALQIAHEQMSTERGRIQDLRDFFWKKIKEQFPSARLNGPKLEDRAPGNLHITFCELSVPAQIRGLALSRGSACLSGQTRMSHVLSALDFSDAEANQSLRISIGRFTTQTDIDRAVQLLSEQIRPSSESTRR